MQQWICNEREGLSCEGLSELDTHAWNTLRIQYIPQRLERGKALRPTPASTWNRGKLGDWPTRDCPPPPSPPPSPRPSHVRPHCRCRLLELASWEPLPPFALKKLRMPPCAFTASSAALTVSCRRLSSSCAVRSRSYVPSSFCLTITTTACLRHARDVQSRNSVNPPSTFWIYLLEHLEPRPVRRERATAPLARGPASAAGRSVFDLLFSAPPPAPSEGLGPLHRKQKQTSVTTVTRFQYLAHVVPMVPRALSAVLAACAAAFFGEIRRSCRPLAASDMGPQDGPRGFCDAASGAWERAR